MGTGKNHNFSNNPSFPYANPDPRFGGGPNADGSMSLSHIAPPVKRTGIFGSGMSGEDLSSAILQAAAIAQGDYAGAGQIAQSLRKQKGDPEFERFVKEAQYKAAHPGPEAVAPMVRDTQAWQNMTDQERKDYRALEELRQPRFEKGPDGMYYPVANAQPGHTVLGTDLPPGWKVDQGGAAPGAGGPFGPQGGARLSPEQAWSFIAPHEGGYSSADANGAPVNHGINQAANPDINVGSLTPQGAQQLFHDRYWKPSGAANLPAPLAAAHADTYYINPSKAQQILSQSGGDPGKYMDMREAWLGSLAQQPKFSRYGKAWSNRNANLRQYQAMLGQGGS